MVPFVANVLVAFIVVPPADAAERSRAQRALARLVEYSSSPMWRNTLGDPLSDAMRPIYSKTLTVRLVSAGGLAALLGDWLQSAVSGLCEKRVKDLPDSAWEHQSEESLHRAMQAIITKLETQGEEKGGLSKNENILTTPLFAKVMHAIFSRYGVAPFARASTLSHRVILFYFLHRRPGAYGTQAAMLALLKKYTNVEETTRRRHEWTILSISGRWDVMDMYGCANPGCKERERMEELKRRRVRGVRDPVVEDRLFRWGAASKACTGCFQISYCSSTCQTAHWRAHKGECTKAQTQDRSQLETEI